MLDGRQQLDRGKRYRDTLRYLELILKHRPAADQELHISRWLAHERADRSDAVAIHNANLRHTPTRK